MEAAPDAAQPRWQRALRRTASLILHQWLLIGIGIVCALAYCFPDVAKHGGTIRSEYSIMYGVIAIIFLISGLSIPRQKLISQVLNWRLHVIVQVISFLFIPALVLAIVHIILAADPGGKIDRAVLAGYIFTACIPTTIASNVVMTRSAGGDDAAALVEVLLANILGPFVTAAWTIALMPKTGEFGPWRYGGGDLGSMYKEVFQQLGLSVLLPLFVGQLLRWTWPDRTAWFLQKTKLPKLATCCLLLLIWATFSSCFATGALQTLSAQSIVFVVLFNIILYITLTAVCFFCSRPPRIFSSRRWSKPIFKRMSPEETIAVCFCGPAKSTALGIPLLYAMWQPVDLFLKAKTSVPVLLYTTEQICVAHFFVRLFRWWHARIVEKEDLDHRIGDDVEIGMAEDSRVDHAGRDHEHFDTRLK
ncbi:sodium bile acid cotransporter [Penicillium robsamsonii]|uniref:sodium bile acid cotransporter n=1 Tax=Penicillium robsamsonii TaxID=1792511 RepID=UPI002547E78B|nr:sodium bile acid cotransporter [Penicillium robsamsonii]KAJ5812998.1 sodium bile acid cotransporter [Penicillium robsamsonii]